MYLLGLHPTACKSQTCPRLLQSLESAVELGGLMDGGAYRSEAKFWSNTIMCGGSWAGHGSRLPSWGGGVARNGGIDVSLAPQLPGKAAEPPGPPL